MSGLFGLFERRSLENPARPLTDASLLELVGGATTDAGVQVTETSAMKQSAVYWAVALISGLGGALPLHTYETRSRLRVDSALLANPHPDMTGLELWRLSYAHRALWGNFYAQKIRAVGGQLRWLYPITPDRIKLRKVRPAADNEAGKLYEVTDDWGTSHVLGPDEVLHIPHIGLDGVQGLSPIRLAAQAIGLATAAESHGSRLFGSGNLLSGILHTEQRLEEKQATALKTRWRERNAGLRGSHDVAVLDSGAKFQSLTMPNDDAQLLESRHFQITDIARYFGVPAFLLGQTEKSTSWGTGLEQQAQGFVTFDLHPMWLAPTEQRITRDVLPGGRYAKYALEGLLRGDSAARAAFYTAMRTIGAFNVDDIRELEDRPPLPNGLGQGHLQPLNMAPLGSTPDPTGGTGDGTDQPGG